MGNGQLVKDYRNANKEKSYITNMRLIQTQAGASYIPQHTADSLEQNPLIGANTAPSAARPNAPSVSTASHVLSPGTPISSLTNNIASNASSANVDTKASRSLSEILSSGKVGRNMVAGAAVGAILGGLNPAGNDGLMGGGMGGAMVGASMGGLAATANAFFNESGNSYLSKGGRLMPSPITDTSVKPGKLGVAMSVGGVVGGLMGGLIGGSGRGKRHTSIDSNGWSQGTHPAYF